MTEGFRLQLAGTNEQVNAFLVEASFAALVAAAWTRFDAIRFAHLSRSASPEIPEEALTEWLEVSFKVTAETLSPSHPFRSQLERFAHEVALPSLRRGRSPLLPRLYVVPDPPPGGGEGGSR